MLRQSARRNAAGLMAADVAATLVALAAAWFLRFQLRVFPVTKGVPDAAAYWRLAPLLALLWPIVYSFHGLYRLRRGRSRSEEAFVIFTATALAVVLLAGIATFYRAFSYSRLVLVIFFVCDVPFVVAARLLVRSHWEANWRKGIGIKRAVIAGAGHLGRAVVDRLIDHPEAGMAAAVLLDDDPALHGGYYRGVPVAGPTTESGDWISAGRADTVFLALPLDAHRRTLDLVRDVVKAGGEVRVVPDLLQYITFRAGLEDWDGLPVVHLTETPVSGWTGLVKRGLDIALSLAGLAALALLLPFIALAIKISDRGSVFYSQRRMGLDGRSFRMWKFRSMRPDAEEESGAVWARPADPRRTAVGAFLRRWSIDELPQLYNVLKGDMSLVGPRPERPEFVAEFKDRFPQYMLRHRVRAGITGWAQVHGWRGSTSLAKRIEYDLYYIENWSLALDFRILWMTLVRDLRENAV
jgi:exopolysaccharide biosynthesis polyprenyl glycosylphosphotransferase